jgi:putative CocE/NonD family hydrolase
LNVAVSFLSLVAGDVIEKLGDKGEDVSELHALFNEVKADPSKAYTYLPLKDVPQFDMPGVKEIWLNLLGIVSSEGQTGGTEQYPYHNVQIPTLNVAGWYDPWLRLTFHTFQNIRDKAGSSYAREHQHLFVGPWCHHKPTRILGDIDFGPLAGENGSRAWEYQLAFFDRYLKGNEIDIPCVRYFTMGENTWKDSEEWPLPDTDWQRFYLHSAGGANSRTGDGSLTRDMPGEEQPDSYVYDPSRPVPTTGGKGAEAENGFVSGPIDQIHVENRDDVLCYTTPCLEKDVEVTGLLDLHLYVSTSCKDTDFSAKLVDLYPDGKAYNIADGITRVKHRNSFDKAELVEPGEIFEILIRLGPISQLFKRDHNIRLDITSSDFPAFDRNMNTGNPTGVDSKGIPVSQTIYHQTEYASYIDLPVIPD